MIKEYLVDTEDAGEQIEIGRRLVRDVTSNVAGQRTSFYNDLMLSSMDREIRHYAPALDPAEREALRCRFVYDYWMFGCPVDEEFYLHLKDMTHAEKREYMVRQMRNVYVNHLNRAAGPDRIRNLADKYRLYQILKPFYKREIIEVRSMEDLPAFEAFARQFGEFVVKPSDLSLGIGVHKFSMAPFGEDYAAALAGILNERQAINAGNPARSNTMVLEELICQEQTLSALHPASVNAVRATAVRGKDGKIHIFHPWLKVGIKGSFVATAAQEGFVAEIDADTGRLISDGFQETGDIYTHHPDTGIRIKGFQIPRWEEIKVFVNEIMESLPNYGYIGWDLVLTPKGWCVMEGNYSGEFMYQLINGRGFKREFEELIGWKYNKDFWWESVERYAHN